MPPLCSAVIKTLKQMKVSMMPSITLCRKKPKSHVCIGDFNMKTRSAQEIHPHIVVCYGKGLTNSKGDDLMRVANENNLKTASKQLHHNYQHLVTWQSTTTTNWVETMNAGITLFEMGSIIFRNLSTRNHFWRTPAHTQILVAALTITLW